MNLSIFSRLFLPKHSVIVPRINPAYRERQRNESPQRTLFNGGKSPQRSIPLQPDVPAGFVLGGLAPPTFAACLHRAWQDNGIPKLRHGPFRAAAQPQTGPVAKKRCVEPGPDGGKAGGRLPISCGDRYGDSAEERRGEKTGTG